mmetsp:Transcript_10402/g.20786  ORF Transcript_10402/g.20786 Transcript_10402/m.20786 type:complete len:213 (+) Transcript_10402:227-865(+)
MLSISEVPNPTTRMQFAGNMAAVQKERGLLSTGPTATVFLASCSTSVVLRSLPSLSFPPMTRTPPSSGSTATAAPRRAVIISGPGEDVPLRRSSTSVVMRLRLVLLLPPMTNTRSSGSSTAEKEYRGQLISGPGVVVPVFRSTISVDERENRALEPRAPPRTRVRPWLKGRAAHPQRPASMLGPGDQVTVAGLSTSVEERGEVPLLPPTTIT